MLLKELLTDPKFNNHVLEYDLNKLQSEDKFVSYVLIIISLLKSTLQRNDNQLKKHKLITLIYILFHHCHSNMNFELKFATEDKSTYLTQGLYEKLLTNFTAFATTLNAEEFVVLERNMMDSILGSDCMPALFSANTWSLLARVISPPLLLSQLTSLCKIYQELEKNSLFSHSPQKVHLSFTISGLFKAMQEDNKVKIYNLFSVNDVRNYDLWASLQIKYLPDDLQFAVESILAEKLKGQFRQIGSGADIENMIKMMYVAATCSMGNNDLFECVVKGWDKACPKNNLVTLNTLCKETLWYFNYVSSLVSFTISMENWQKIYLIKVLHVIAEFVKKGNTELKLVVINNICKFISLEVNDANKLPIECLLIQLIMELSKDTQNIVKYKLFSTLRESLSSSNLHRIIKEIIKEDYLHKDIWDAFLKNGVLIKSSEWKKQLLTAKDIKYRHKCLESNVFDSKPDSMEKMCSGNFELADIDSLFENESDSEQPVHKKVKLNRNEADAIITRLENEVSLLCKVKANIFTSEQKTKIRILYDQLRNIISD